MEIKTLIVDDEPLALDVLETYVERMPELTLVAKCNNAFEANKAVSENEIDLMFLDIQMPQLSGIEFLKSLSKPPLVIFTTAYPDYALEGFELDAIDYLLKPISADRFLKAANKAISQIKLQEGHQPEKVEADDADFIFVKADKKYVKVLYDDILYIEGLKDYVIIKQKTSRVITLQTMKSLEEKLPIKTFKRIHRSYILNTDKINAVIGNMVEVLENGKAKHLPIGKNYRDELLDMVQKNRL